mmetsp:Transcript_11715/g.11350  ORF Transcript_11715/g.11350 Transcript_11715/m.11350 type:complete len:345 (+) Transcript_11715:449-1483(+)
MNAFHKKLSRCLFSNQNYCIVVSIYKWSIVGFRFFMRIVGPFMLLLANALIFSVLYIFLTKLLSKLVGDSLFLYALHLSIGIILVINVSFNYLHCAFTPPGSPEICEDPGKYFGQMTSVINDKVVYQIKSRLDLAPAVSYRYCRECRAIKPPRAHHCSISGKCILHMDHYCPWMNNCIGYYNYRYFILFLIWLFLGAVYVISITYEPFFSIQLDQRTALSATNSRYDAEVFYVFILGISSSIAVGVLLVYHSYLCLTNQTTIECYLNVYEREDAKAIGMIFKNPYDMGWRKNLRRVFGDTPWYASLFISRRRPVDPEYPFLPDEIVDVFNSNTDFRRYGMISRA